MKIAIFTVSLPEWTPDEAISRLAGIGYDGVEWRVVDDPPQATPGFWRGNRCTLPLSSSEADLVRVRGVTKDAGLEVPAIASYVQAADLANVERVMRGARALGTSMARIQTPRYDGTSGFIELRDQARADFRAVERLARDYGVKALVEIHNDTIVPSASATRLFLDSLDPAWVGAIHDAGNMVREGYERYRLGLETLGPYLAHVHVKNTSWRPAGVRNDGSAAWEAYWSPLDAGMANLGELFDALRAIGYDGWVSVEDFTTESPLEVRVRQNAAFLRAAIAAG